MKSSKQTSLGYFFTLFTVAVWGTTFIASKQLLTVYTPARIMLMRFILAYIALWIIRPRPLKLPWESELRFAALGITGCSLYFLTENTALLHTTAANVSIIVSAAPIFTAILAHFTLDEKFHRNTLFGFLVASTGVVLVVCNGHLFDSLRHHRGGSLHAEGAGHLGGDSGRGPHHRRGGPGSEANGKQRRAPGCVFKRGIKGAARRNGGPLLYFTWTSLRTP